MTTYVIHRLLLVPILLIGVMILIFGMFLGSIEHSIWDLRDIPKNDRAVQSGSPNMDLIKHSIDTIVVDVLYARVDPRMQLSLI